MQPPLTSGIARSGSFLSNKIQVTNYLKNNLMKTHIIKISLIALLIPSLSNADIFKFPAEGYDMIGFAGDIIRGAVIVTGNDTAILEETHTQLSEESIQFVHYSDYSENAIPGPFVLTSGVKEQAPIRHLITIDIDNNINTGVVNETSWEGDVFPAGGWEYLVMDDTLYKAKFSTARSKRLKEKKELFEGLELIGSVTENAYKRGVTVTAPRELLGDPSSFSVTWHNQYFDPDTKATLYSDTYGPWFYDDSVEDVKSNPVTSDQFTLDGDITDWKFAYGFEDDLLDVIIEDGDNDNQIDWLNIKIAHSTDSNELFFAYKNATEIELHSGFMIFLDVDHDLNTGYNGSLGGGNMPIGADYLISGDRIWKHKGNRCHSWSWTRVCQSSDISSYTDGSTLEMAFPMTLLGNPSSLDFFCVGDNACHSNASNQLDFYPDTAFDGGFFRYTISRNSIGKTYQYNYINQK